MKKLNPVFRPQHILVPVAVDALDDASIAERSVRTACDLAQAFSARITLLNLTPQLFASFHVEGDVPEKVFRSMQALLQARVARGREKIEQLRAMIEEQKVSVSQMLLDAPVGVAEGIRDVAREEHCDLIVIGSHARHGLKKVLLGSVAEKVAHLSPCPVLILR